MDTCPSCQRLIDRQLLALASELIAQVATLAARSIAHWKVGDGLCPDCALALLKQFTAQRALDSLHTTSDPHTTFPYYHPDEEFVLSQTERLPNHTGFDGAGVTIAFLDSGYFPHPDLGFSFGSTFARSSPILHDNPATRLVDYIDLTGGVERRGLDQPSLWTGAGDSWHGQMTTVLATGNGQLSGGRYGGYALAASILPIKIGRGDGRIPESDILAGLNWLLRHDNWQRYAVRVLNISVGGDFIQSWDQNPVCLAAEKLIERGVFIAAAAGNSNREALLAPAQTPNVMTVGGYEDANRLWQPQEQSQVEQLTLYHHNWGSSKTARVVTGKPEILALGRHVPGPILPTSPVWHEMTTIDELRRVLGIGGGEARGWKLESSDQRTQETKRQGDKEAIRNPQTRLQDSSLAEVDRAVRKSMNAHKWIHRHYQHVEGTSVAVTQVSAVAAQMFQANSALTPLLIRQIISQSALPLPHLPAHLTGHGVLQPTLAVAQALRIAGGRLAGLPRSASLVVHDELQKWPLVGKVSGSDADPKTRMVYFGFFAPNAHSVSLIGSFNQWQPGTIRLQKTAIGWWHGVVAMPSTSSPYRFWVEKTGLEAWVADPENPARNESGYSSQHSVI